MLNGVVEKNGEELLKNDGKRENVDKGNKVMRKTMTGGEDKQFCFNLINFSVQCLFTLLLMYY